MLYLVIYQGLGLVLAILFVFAGALIAHWLGDALHLERLEMTYLGVILMAIPAIAAGYWLNHRKSEVRLINKATGEVVTQRARHSLYFINLEYWGLILLAVGAYFLYGDIRSGALNVQHLTAAAGLG